jgi:hypothetical protein
MIWLGVIGWGIPDDPAASLVEANGWEVRCLDGEHLHLLTAPDEVAETVPEVVERLS